MVDACQVLDFNYVHDWGSLLFTLPATTAAATTAATASRAAHARHAATRLLAREGIALGGARRLRGQPRHRDVRDELGADLQFGRTTHQLGERAIGDALHDVEPLQRAVLVFRVRRQEDVHLTADRIPDNGRKELVDRSGGSLCQRHGRGRLTSTWTWPLVLSRAAAAGTAAAAKGDAELGHGRRS